MIGKIKFQTIQKKPLITKFASYLEYDDTLRFSRANKKLNEILEPKNNKIINVIFILSILNIFFEYSYKEIYKQKIAMLINCLKDKDAIDSKFYLKELKIKFKNFKYKNISKKVLKLFQLHLFLLDLRKENYILEYEGNSIYLQYSYDVLYHNRGIINYYSYYITKKHLEIEKKPIEILREGIFFQSFLVDFLDTFTQLTEQKIYMEILDDLLNYRYEKLDKYNLDNINIKYEKNPKNDVKEIIDFILWINSTFVLFSKFINDYLKSFINDTKPEILILEFSTNFNNLVNICLSLNSQFENINIIINHLVTYDNGSSGLKLMFEDSSENKMDIEDDESFEINIIKDNVDDNVDIIYKMFALYKLFMKIIKKEIFDDIFPILIPKFGLLLDQFFEQSFVDFKNIVDEDKNDDDMMSMEDEEMNDETKPTHKEIIEKFLNCIEDMTFNALNANGVNHTEIKVNEIYKKVEDILIEKFTEFLKQKVAEKKCVFVLYNLVHEFTKTNGNSRHLLFNKRGLNIIRRTKKILLEESYQIIYRYLILIIAEDLALNKIQNEQCELENKKKIDTSYQDLSDLPQKYRHIVEPKIEKQIESSKKDIVEKYKKEQYQKEEISLDSVNKYFENSGNEYVYLLNKLIWTYYKELGFYDERNHKIEKILSSKENNNDKGKSDDILGEKGKNNVENNFLIADEIHFHI